MGGHKLIFAGRLVEGQDRSDCIDRLARLFHQDRQWAEQRLFGGQAVIIKTVENPALAARYVAAFRQAGAVLEVDPPLPEPAVEAQPGEPAAAGAEEAHAVEAPVESPTAEQDAEDAPPVAEEAIEDPSASRETPPIESPSADEGDIEDEWSPESEEPAEGTQDAVAEDWLPEEAGVQDDESAGDVEPSVEAEPPTAFAHEPEADADEPVHAEADAAIDAEGAAEPSIDAEPQPAFAPEPEADVDEPDHAEADASIHAEVAAEPEAASAEAPEAEVEADVDSPDEPLAVEGGPAFEARDDDSADAVLDAGPADVRPPDAVDDEPEPPTQEFPVIESMPETDEGLEPASTGDSEPEREAEAADEAEEPVTAEMPVVEETPEVAAALGVDDDASSSPAPAPETEPKPAPAAGRHWGVPVAVGLLVVVSLITGGWWYWKNQVQSVVPQSVLRIEDALAGDEVIAMGVIDVAAAAQVESALVEEPAVDLAAASPLVDLLQSAGTDLRRDVHHVLFALESGGEDAGRYAVALTGQFEPDRLRAAMASRFDIRSDGDALVIRFEDPATCEWSREWAVDLAEDRILVATPEAMAPLRQRLDAETLTGGRDLTGWRTARSGQLFSLALMRPSEIHRAADGMAGMMLAGAGEQLQPVEALYLGLSLQPLPPGGRLDLSLVSGDAQWVGQIVTQANEGLDQARQQLTTMGPAAGQLLQGVSVDQVPAGIQGTLTIDQSLAENLQQAVSDLVSGFFGGGLMLGDGSPTEEQIDEDPTPFLTQYDAGSIPGFHSIDDASFPADAVSGPFGVRVTQLSLDPSGGLAVSLAAEGRQIQNLGENAGRAFMRVMSVRSADGRELLKRESCGEDRNDQPMALEHQMDGSTFSEDGEFVEYAKINGQKTYRLVADTRPEDVVLVDIEFRVDLPIRTETRVLAMPLDGQSMTVDGTELRFKAAGPSDLSYEILGDPSPILAIRALNADQQHLSYSGGTWGDRLFGEGRSATTQYYGEVAFAEIVVVTESQPLRYPLTLERVLPAFSETIDPRPPAALEPADPEAFDAAFAESGPPSVPEDARGWFEPDATGQAGPFAVELSGLQAGGFWGLYSSFTVRGPLVGALQHNLGGVRLAIDEAMTPEGAEPLAHVSPVTLVRPGGYYMNGEYQADPDRAYLEGQGSFQVETELETIIGVNGRVLVTLPTTIDRIDFDGLSLGTALDASGLSLVPVSLSADRLELRVEGDPALLMAVEVYDADGQMIAADGQTLEGSVASVPFSGHPQRVSVVLATETAQREYPFQLAWATEQ